VSAARTFHVVSELEAVPGVVAEIATFCAELAVHAEERAMIELCLAEAINNAIEHAYGLEAGHAVEIIVALQRDDVLTIDVRDCGRPMPTGRLLDEPKELDPTNVASLPERGMGLAILRRAMDALTYASEDAVNTLTLTKRVRRTDLENEHDQAH
jgi:serine/threonine-protein kinase RsbW